MEVIVYFMKLIKGFTTKRPEARRFYSYAKMIDCVHQMTFDHVYHLEAVQIL